VALPTLALGYYFSPPGHLLGPDAIDLPFILFFSLSAILITWVSAKRKAMEEALKHAYDDLEAKVEERTADLQRLNDELRAEDAERRRAEEELRRSEAYLSEGQRLTHTGSWAWNVADRENVYWSQEHYRIFGFDPDKDISSYQDALNRIFADDLPGFEQSFATAIQEKKDFERDFRIVLPDGSMRYLHSIGHPIIDQSGEVVEFIGTCMDLTERKHAEEELQRAQAELAHVTRLTTLGELTASIAHEVNQPLAAVALNANACLRWLAGESPNLIESRQAIQRIVKEANRASEVIGRIRTLARKAPPRREPADINEVLLEVIALARGELRRNRVELQTQLVDGLPFVLADRVQLQQVVLNLIINSVEAMSGAGVGLRELRISSASHEETGVLVAVRDSGVGLDPKNLDRLFDAFHTTKPDGMGMGLAISRSIIEAHGGRLWATAAEPSGAVFQFTLPV
jgi:PAS domain S-box-containing protein